MSQPSRCFLLSAETQDVMLLESDSLRVFAAVVVHISGYSKNDLRCVEQHQRSVVVSQSLTRPRRPAAEPVSVRAGLRFDPTEQ